MPEDPNWAQMLALCSTELYRTVSYFICAFGVVGGVRSAFLVWPSYMPCFRPFEFEKNYGRGEDASLFPPVVS